MKTSELDAAVESHFTRVKDGLPHNFETIMLGDKSGEYCRNCGKSRDACRKEPNSYDLHPCRGLIG